MRYIGQLEPHFVRPRRQSHEDYRFAAGIDRWPGLIVDVIVQMSDARRHLQSGFAKYRKDAQIFSSVLDKHASQSQAFGNRWIHDEFGWRLALNCDQRRWTFDIPPSLGRGGERIECNGNADHSGLRDDDL